MEEPHRGVGPLFIPPAEGPPAPFLLLQHPYIRLARLSGACGIRRRSVRTAEELSTPNPPSEPSAERVFQVCSPRATPLICVTSHGALLERGRRVLRLLRLNDVEEARGASWETGGREGRPPPLPPPAALWHSLV